MTDFKTQVQHLLGPLLNTNPQLYTAISLIVSYLQDVEDQLNPIQVQIAALQVPDQVPPFQPINLIATIFPDYIKLDWDAVDAIPRIYEVREGDVGIDWTLASFIARTPSTEIQINPANPVGVTRRYLVKALSATGVYSLTTAIYDLVIPGIAPPILSAQVIDNNVLLSWTSSIGPHRIRQYHVYKDDNEIGVNDGNFTVIFETVSGNYTYKVQAEDIAGNLSSLGTITVRVNQPPDFELFSSWESQFRVMVP